MSFLAPLFLLGALAVAAPVIFHLIRRTTRERTPFSSLLFLQPDPPRLTERSRVEHWLLLLLRAAALALLALAFARPFFRAEAVPQSPDGSAKRTVLLVDVSASMRRSGLREASLEKAESVLAKAGPGDAVMVLAFGDGTKTLMDFTQWSELPPESRAAQAMARLKEAELTWEGTDLSEALTTAADLLREQSGSGVDGGARAAEGGEIVVVTDLQDGSRLTGLQGRDWPRGATVSMALVAPQKPGNAGITLAAEGTPPVGGGVPPARVRVWNAQDSGGEQFQLGWAAADGVNFAGKALDVYVPPGQARVVSLDWPEGAGAQAAGRILLKGDAEPFDNLIHAVPPSPAKVTAFYFGSEAAEDPKQPLFFLNRALPQSRLVTVELVPLPPAAAVPAEEIGKSAVYFVGGSPSKEQTETLRKRITEGDMAVVVLTNIQQAASLAGLAGVDVVKLEEAPADKYAMLGEIDFKHPLFAPFADPRFSDFTKIRFWHHRKLEAAALPGSRVLAKFDSGDPAVLELPVGKGRLVVLTSGWHPADSQLALSSKFVPLMASLLESGGVVRTPVTQFAVSAPVPRVTLGFAEGLPVAFTLPDGKSASMEAGAAAFTQNSTPGLYTASAAGRTLTFAVNPDQAESRTAPLPVEELEKLDVPIAGAASTVKSAAREMTADPGAVETESRQKLWKWIIVIALGVLLFETLLAGLTARRAIATPISNGGPAV
ncbi:MAG: BatA domain-containing protein [Verrucomicrobiota bacterium]